VTIYAGSAFGVSVDYEWHASGAGDIVMDTDAASDIIEK
jgi:hypothetical protein